MRTLVLALMLASIAMPVGAAEWTAGMEEDEGGPIFSAAIRLEGEGYPPALRMICNGGSGFLMYDRGDKVEPPGGIDDEADFVFATEAGSATLHLQFQDMDGTFAGEFGPSDPLVGYLHSGSTLTITDSAGRFGAQEFPLAGSAAALGALIGQCG